MQVKILTYGGIIQSIQVPGRGGHGADVVLGFKTPQDYVNLDSPAVTANGGPYFGKTIGRYGNRIAKGTFTLDGKTYTLLNNGVLNTTQHYPNSPNQPNFPSTELKPGQVFSSSTIFQFSA